MTDAVRVLMVEDHEMVARGLAAVLEDDPGLTVLGWAASAEDALDRIDAEPPDVVLMDFRLPGIDGVEATRRVRERHPGTQVVMLTATDSTALVLDAVDAGACGFVSKHADIDDLLHAVHAAANGEAYFSGEHLANAVKSRRGAASPDVPLSRREIEVLQLVANGVSTPDIAEQLFLSHHTVRNHVRNILGKLGAHSKLEAVVIAARAGVVTLDAAPSA